MQCPECSSDHIRKNGINRQGKQNYICVNCSRQFIDRYEPHQGYSDGLRNECLTMYVNGMGFRAIALYEKYEFLCAPSIRLVSESTRKP